MVSDRRQNLETVLVIGKSRGRHDTFRSLGFAKGLVLGRLELQRILESFGLGLRECRLVLLTIIVLILRLIHLLILFLSNVLTNSRTRIMI